MNEALLLTKITINNIYICKGSLVPPCRYTTTESTSELLQKIIMKKKNLCSTRNVYTKQLNLRQGCNLILQPASQIYKLDADLKKKKKKSYIQMSTKPNSLHITRHHICYHIAHSLPERWGIMDLDLCAFKVISTLGSHKEVTEYPCTAHGAVV